MGIFVAACVTVNIYFPAAEVQKAADQIVEEVSKEPASSEPEKGPSPSQSLREDVLVWVARLLVPPAEAAVDIEVSTPAIRALKKSMKKRFAMLKPYYVRGVVGENNRGYLEIRDSASLSLKEKARLKSLVKDENRDRRALYEEIIRANKMDAKVLPQVEGLFANSWREKRARPGWWIQSDDGTWVQK
jgi:uncharacterized protein YdbL (DUF1318 family)